MLVGASGVHLDGYASNFLKIQASRIAMDEEDAIRTLEREGFSQVYVHEDLPGAEYPAHTHPVLTAHIIVQGEMILVHEGKTCAFCEGERVDVPAGAVHSARMGPEGCRYAVGEKQ